MALKTILTDEDPALHKVCRPVEKFDGRLHDLLDDLKETLRTGHILRLQQGECSSVAGFVWSDILTNLERTSDHCSNVAGCIIDMSRHELHLHESQREFRNTSEDYRQNYLRYRSKYALT